MEFSFSKWAWRLASCLCLVGVAGGTFANAANAASPSKPAKPAASSAAAAPAAANAPVVAPGAEAGVEIPKSPADFHIYVLAGQSNMAGRGKIPKASATTPRTANASKPAAASPASPSAPASTTADAIAPSPRVLVLGKNGKWRVATDPLHFDKPGSGVGLGLSFAHAMLADAPAGTVIGLVPCGVGGSAIDDWKPGRYYKATRSHPWDDTLRRTRSALLQGTLKGMLWHQGESDAYPALRALYLGKLAKLAADMRAAFDAPAVPFVVGEILPQAGGDNGERFNEIIRDAPKTVPGCAVVSAENLRANSAKDWAHFDTPSQRQLGLRYAQKMKLLQAAAAPAAK